MSGDDHNGTGDQLDLDAPVTRCTCGMHAIVMGTVPDPDCPMHGGRGINAWSTCADCGRTWRHVVGHDCKASS